MKLLVLSFLVFTTACFGQSSSGNLKKQTGDNEWSKGKAQKWFNKKKWLSGLTITPDNTIDKQEFAKQYHAHQDRWDKAFAFFKNTNLADLKPGRYTIDGENVYATVTDGKLREMNTSSYEAHKHYADIQYVISGSEQIGVAPFEGAVEKVAYDPEKDIAFYDAAGQFYKATPQTFFIFFPERNAHRPGITSSDSDHDKKLVIKVKTD